MSRILTPVTGEWFDELKAVAYCCEAELESWFSQHAESLFPHHYVIPFKKTVARRGTRETSRPDLVLIRRDFINWVVVEVELKQHTINHVLGQVRVFLDCEYNSLDIAEYVKVKFKEIYNKPVALSRLKNLFNSVSPSILVIANENVEEWKKRLGQLGVQFGVFEVYKNVQGDHVYRTSGEYPLVHVDKAHCRPHRVLRNMVEIVGKFTFTDVNDGDNIDVFYNGCLTRWSLIKQARKQYLRFVGFSNPVPLSHRDTYGLYRDKSNKYYLKRS